MTTADLVGTNVLAGPFAQVNVFVLKRDRIFATEHVQNSNPTRIIVAAVETNVRSALFARMEDVCFRCWHYLSHLNLNVPNASSTNSVEIYDI